MSPQTHTTETVYLSANLLRLSLMATKGVHLPVSCLKKLANAHLYPLAVNMFHH